MLEEDGDPYICRHGSAVLTGVGMNVGAMMLSSFNTLGKDPRTHRQTTPSEEEERESEDEEEDSEREVEETGPEDERVEEVGEEESREREDVGNKRRKGKRAAGQVADKADGTTKRRKRNVCVEEASTQQGQPKERTNNAYGFRPAGALREPRYRKWGL
jgi:uncharacterized protein YhaN